MINCFLVELNDFGRYHHVTVQHADKDEVSQRLELF